MAIILDYPIIFQEMYGNAAPGERTNYSFTRSTYTSLGP